LEKAIRRSISPIRKKICTSFYEATLRCTIRRLRAYICTQIRFKKRLVGWILARCTPLFWYFYCL